MSYKKINSYKRHIKVVNIDNNIKDMDKGNKNNLGQNYIQKLKEIGIFSGEEHLMYVLKKSERILAALYLVSDLLSDSEPLKWTLRERGADIHSLSFLMNTGDPTQKNVALQNLFLSITETVSYLRVGLLSGLITQMNFDLLDQELMLLVDTLNERAQEERRSHGYVLSETFFDTTGVAEQVLSKFSKNNRGQNVLRNGNRASTPLSQKDSLNKRQDKIGGARDSSVGQASVEQSSFNEGVINYNGSEYVGGVKSLGIGQGQSSVDVSPVEVKKDNRRTKILDLVSKRSGLTIKDFAEVIKDCSEKTIQRELVELVEQGVLVRQGERRWSTYSLRVN